LTAPATKNAPRIGDLLLKEGLITQDQLNKALQEQRNNGTRVGYNLVKLGYVKETDLTRMLARQHKMPAVDLTKFQVDPRIAKLIPAELALKHSVLPLKRDGRTLTVAMSDPATMSVLDDIKFITRLDIFPVIAGEFTLRNAIEKFYESGEAQMQSLLRTRPESLDDLTIQVALVRPGLPLWVHAVQFALFGAVNSLQFTAMNTLALRDLDGELASGGNSLLSMVMMLSMSLGVAVAGGLLGAFGGAGGDLDTLSAFRWSFVCVGLVTITSAAIFAQLEPTHRLAPTTVQEAEAQ